jgi:succinate dehydrogenase / fumarate reductase cytochrome b subunit
VQLLLKSQVGNKLLMAVSGQLMILFVIVHVLGNDTIFTGGLNAYAAKLHSQPLLLWTTRFVMFVMFSIHVFFGVRLYLENRKAKPEAYAMRKNLSATFASRTMIWTGLIIGAFLVYHLLHFTFQVIQPLQSARLNPDALGRPDVAAMVISAFQNFGISSIYIIALGALVLHLAHGIQSSFQSLGLNNEFTLPAVKKAGTVAAVVLFLGYTSIPVIILLGIMKG